MILAAARAPADDGGALLVLDGSRLAGARPRVVPLAGLAQALDPGDLVVLNDAATLPASLSGHTESGAPVELRLARAPDAAGRALAVLFGAGDWRTPTEHRPAPPRVAAGDRLVFDGLVALVRHVHPGSPRLLQVRLDPGDDARWTALYRAGRPIQYSHVAAPLPLWQVQTAWAGRPWAVEAPSASFGLDARALDALTARGVALATVTEGAGLSSTGDPWIDARLPFPEPWAVPDTTVAAVARTREAGGRVVAVGTSVARALEAAAAGGVLRAGEGVTGLRLGPDRPRHVVDALLSGLHVPGEPHYALLRAFAPDADLRAALHVAAGAGLRAHEFGDHLLVLPSRRRLSQSVASAAQGPASAA